MLWQTVYKNVYFVGTLLSCLNKTTDRVYSVSTKTFFNLMKEPIDPKTPNLVMPDTK